MAGAHSREFGSQDFYGGRGRGSIQGFSAGIVALFHPSIPTFFQGFFWGFGVFFFCASRENHRILSEGSLGIPKGWSWERTGSGSALGFGRIRDGIWDPGWNLGWKNPGWNPGWNLEFGMEESGLESGIWHGRIQAGTRDPSRNLGWKNLGWNPGSKLEFGMEESRLESGIQAGIWAGRIPGMWSRSNTPESPKSLGIETIPSRPSGMIQRLRIPGKPWGKPRKDELNPKIPSAFPRGADSCGNPGIRSRFPSPCREIHGDFSGRSQKIPGSDARGAPSASFPSKSRSVLGIPGWERPKFRRRRKQNLGKSRTRLPVGIPGVWDWN
ncbi:PREDICTED: uncharacterized protein LOC108445225 isoform X2 [Corvus brachyrhynchos]|uniref:uncharacterized protein LOC108445225 isoform X2 n=1 Tax=Corvus brachyrhynchos TaxID=85066 RepID=UPI0008165750|nr:PREDICTED: uncharacterized protein LOC108445225 isoform X2 [Corvus brachyrhynchos]